MQNLRVEAVVESFSRVSGLPDIDPVPYAVKNAQSLPMKRFKSGL
jgi:hypothetical protein